jgi:hydrogenase expression/formation protein HypC
LTLYQAASRIASSQYCDEGDAAAAIVEPRCPLDADEPVAAADAPSEKGVLMCLAIPGQVLEFVDEPNRLAKVDVAGVHRNVNVGLLEDGDAPQVGDWVLIHVGFALSKVDEEEAQATLRLLQQMGEAYEQELEDLKTSGIQ